MLLINVTYTVCLVFYLGFLLLQINTMAIKKVAEERVNFSYTYILLFMVKRNHDRNSNRARTSSQDLMLLTALLSMASSALDGSTHNELHPPPSITNYENKLQLDLMDALFQLRFSPFR